MDPVFCWGHIIRISDVAATLHVLSEDTRSLIFAANSGTVITLDGKRKTLASLQVGDRVRVITDGQTALAARIDAAT